jgi:drug/metabolite transporter (DMT)-like permease
VTAPSPAPHGISGWIEAALFVVAIAILSIAYSVGSQFNAHPIAFILIAMVTSSTLLLATTGFGSDARAIIATPLSWVVGTLTILLEVFYYMLLTYVPPAPGSVLVRFSIPMAIVIAWLIFHRRPRALAVIGGAMVLAACTSVWLGFSNTQRLPAILAGLGSALSFVGRNFASERHPWNRPGASVYDKLRFTGIVVMITSIVGVAATALAGGLIAAGIVPQTPLVPTLQQLWHPPTMLLGLCVGGLLLTAMAYLTYSSVAKISAENFTAVAAFIPLATLALQQLAIMAGIIPPIALNWTLLPEIAVVITGVLLILTAQRRRA